MSRSRWTLARGRGIAGPRGRPALLGGAGQLAALARGRQVVGWEEYSPSRRSNAPIPAVRQEIADEPKLYPRPGSSEQLVEDD